MPDVLLGVRLPPCVDEQLFQESVESLCWAATYIKKKDWTHMNVYTGKGSGGCLTLHSNRDWTVTCADLPDNPVTIPSVLELLKHFFYLRNPEFCTPAKQRDAETVRSLFENQVEDMYRDLLSILECMIEEIGQEICD